MKSTFHKCIFNVNAAPNPTPMSKLAKYNETNTNRNRSEMGNGGGDFFSRHTTTHPFKHTLQIQ